MKVLLLIFSLSTFAAFTEKEIEPHLGPYQLVKDKYKNCPKEVSLFANCSLGGLTLNHPENPTFVFLDITSLNKGLKVTTEGKRVIEEYSANYKSKVIRTNKKTFLPNNLSFSEKTLLKLNGDLIEYSLVYLDERKTREAINCVFKKDHARWKKQQEDFCKEHPKAYGCDKK